jgi:hypothetical protein
MYNTFPILKKKIEFDSSLFNKSNVFQVSQRPFSPVYIFIYINNDAREIEAGRSRFF